MAGGVAMGAIDPSTRLNFSTTRHFYNLKLISYNYTHCAMELREHFAVLKRILCNSMRSAMANAVFFCSNTGMDKSCPLAGG